MIQSILDTDIYKFSVQNIVCSQFPKEIVRYDFINRDNRQFPDGFADELQRRINHFEYYQLRDPEKEFLREKCYYFNNVYLDFLAGYKFDPSEVNISQKDGDLKISIIGPWYKTVLWEVPLMATISELYFEMTFQSATGCYDNIATSKAHDLNYLDVKVAEFGSRRRYSYEVQKKSLEVFKKHPFLVGTSNVHLAKEFDLNVIGTHPHEWFMFHGAKFGYPLANKLSLDHWVDQYQGDLGIALTDTFTTENFFNSFNKKFSKLFDGVRHDSGDPISFADKTIKHYESMSIDPKTKTIVFSDGINSMELIRKIKNHCKEKINISFGIGTWFSNDVGVKPLNIVIKMTGVKIDNKMVSTVKLSDVSGKNTGTVDAIENCKKSLNLI